MRISKTFILIFFLLTLTLLMVALPVSDAHAEYKVVRMGNFVMDPMVTIDEEKNLGGPLIGITRHIAELEGWDLEIVQCNFAQCLEMLETREIDIATPVAYTKERAKKFGYSKETLIMDWGQIYARDSLNIHSLLDLEGKRIVTLKNTVFNKKFNELLKSFGINIEFIRVDDYLDVFRYVQDGRADAMILNRFFGEKNIGNFSNVEKTPIIFQPIDIRYAAIKGANQDVLDVLDEHLAEMKGDPLSEYHMQINSMLGQVSDFSETMRKIKWVLSIAGSLLLIIIIMNMYLRRKVKQRTSELSVEIGERKQVEATLEKSLREKEVLLKEVHHRVKNNMAIISSMSNLQSYKIKDAKVQAALKEGRSRIRTMALVHEQLYQSDNLSEIELCAYLHRLVDNVKQSYGEGRREEINVDCDDISLDMDTLIPCGLIINELLTNAIKYAYEPDQEGEVLVSMKKTSGGGYLLEVRDWGKGYDGTIDPEGEMETLGMQLVHSLVAQIDGNMEIDGKDGMRVSIRFNMPEA